MTYTIDRKEVAIELYDAFLYTSFGVGMLYL